MVEIARDEAALTESARLLHAFNTEYAEPSPPVDQLARRLKELVATDRVVVLVAHHQTEPVGVAVLRLQPSIWSEGQEAYLAELYVVPERRGQGHGRALLDEVVRVGREAGADYTFLVTSVDDVRAQRAYEAAGFRRTEGEGGPLMLAYERDL